MELNIAIAFDNNYLKQFHALVASIIRNTTANNVVYLHVIAPDIESADASEIKGYLTCGIRDIIFYDIDSDVIKEFVLSNTWTHAVYYRLFFPLIVPNGIKRLLYLDCDTLVLSDLSELFCEELGDYPVGAVYDNYVRKQALLGITEDGQYFNSGVLLIDTTLWRTQQISERAFDYLNNYPERILYVDQCALNAVLYNNWKKLPFRYNTLYTYLPNGSSLRDLMRFISDKVIIHFTLERPWHMLSKNRIGQKLYFSNLRRSRAQRSFFNRYSDFHFLKLPKYAKQRVIFLYQDWSLAQKYWHFVKEFFKVW